MEKDMALLLGNLVLLIIIYGIYRLSQEKKK